MHDGAGSVDSFRVLGVRAGGRPRGLACSGEPHGNRRGSWKRKSVTDENGLVTAWRKGRHDLAAVKACWQAARRLPCVIRAAEVRSFGCGGQAVLTWLDNARRYRADR